MSSLSRWSRTGFTLVAWLFVGCCIVQIYLAGTGVFATGSFELHRNFGYTFGLLTLALIVLALVGRLPGRLIGASALIFGLFALQSVFVALRAEQPLFAALHPLNGVLILLVSMWVAWRTRSYLRPPVSAPSAGSGLEQPVAAEQTPAD